MRAIGGYFELADYGDGVFPHPDGVWLNTGRNALEYILRSLGDVKLVFLPYFDCEVVLEPLKKLHIPWRFYHINAQMEIDGDFRLHSGEYLIANNYFGIKAAYIHQLAKQYGEHLIVDCAQAFFALPVPGVKSFYSPRKFVGVADGGVAYLWETDGVSVSEMECTECHDSHLLIRKELGAEAGFQVYRDNERKLDNQPIRLMSSSTKSILDHIDYEKVVSKRRENFASLHEALGKRNLLHLPAPESFSCPMVYPFLTNDSSLRRRMIENKVFVATYWPNVLEWTDEDSVEYEMAEKLVPLPIDQRYSAADMHYILSVLQC